MQAKTRTRVSSLHVIILAAGQGTRMRSALPKVLHRIGGRALLDHVVRSAHSLNPDAVHVVYGHGGALVRDRLSFLDVNWIEQTPQLGTGHAVSQAITAVPDGAVVLVLYGDVPLIEADALAGLVDRARAGRLALMTVDLEDPTGYGRILRDDNSRVVGIVEDKDASAGQRLIRESNTGILAVGAQRLHAWLGGLDNDNAQGEYYLTDVIALAAAEGLEIEVVQPKQREDVLGVNDRVQLARLERCYQQRQAQRLMCAGATLADPTRVELRGDVEVGEDVYLDVNVILEGRVILGNEVHVGPNCVLRDCAVAAGTQILANCVVEEAEIGAGARIGPYARIRPGTRLGDGVHVGNFVEVKNTTMGRGSKANHLTYLGDSEIGVRVNIGAGTSTCNYDGANKHRTTIGDRVFIGSGVELVAPIRVHDGATIGAGSTISKEAPAEALTLTRAKQVTLKGWRRPVKKGGGEV